MEEKKKKKSKIFFVLAIIGLVITIALSFWHNSYEENTYKEALYDDDNYIALWYDNDVTGKLKEEKLQAERKIRKLENTMNTIKYSSWATGGITIIFFVTGIILKIKEKGGIEIVD